MCSFSVSSRFFSFHLFCLFLCVNSSYVLLKCVFATDELHITFIALNCLFKVDKALRLEYLASSLQGLRQNGSLAAVGLDICRVQP